MVKEKQDKVGEDIFQFMKSQNRPYSLNDLVQSAALKEHGKTALSKSLDQLIIAEKIREKTYNKQKVCVVNQDLMVSASGNVNIAEVDNRIRELTKENADHEAFIKRAQSEIKSMTSSMSIEDAEELLARSKEENDVMLKKIQDIDENGVSVTADDFKEVRQSVEKSKTELRKRKRWCLEMVDNIMESYPNPKKALYDEIGIVEL